MCRFEVNALSGKSADSSAAVTDVGATAAMPLPATSVTASAPNSTVTAVSALVRALARRISNLGPDDTDPTGVACVVVPDFTVILVRSTPPMTSLKKRMIFVPLGDVVGALLPRALVPVVRSVGRMPSTVCPASIVPPVSLVAAIATPFGAAPGGMDDPGVPAYRRRSSG